jgi:hypothetical protein
MALDAQLLFPIRPQWKIVWAAHQVVAGDTGNVPLWPGIDDVRSYGMGELGVSLVTCCAHKQFLIAEKESVIWPMGAMTGAAFSLLHQGVFVVIPFISNVLLGILMARETDLGLFRLLEVALIWSMGTVTAHAKDPRTNVAVDLLEIFPGRRVAG